MWSMKERILMNMENYILKQTNYSGASNRNFCGTYLLNVSRITNIYGCKNCT